MLHAHARAAEAAERTRHERRGRAPTAPVRPRRISCARSSPRTTAPASTAGAWSRAFRPSPTATCTIGHAKSICLNFGLAAENGGVCHLRFDDTNPVKEDVEYVDSIADAVRWLGFDWGAHLYHASDYFDDLYRFAEWFIEQGLAYVDSQSADEMRAHARHADRARARTARTATARWRRTSICSAGCAPASFPTARTCCA